MAKKVKSVVYERLLVDAAAQDDARYVFNSVCMDHKNKVAVSTDGRRLFASVNAYARIGESAYVKTSDKAEETLLETKDVKEYFAGKRSTISGGPDGQFPDWQVIVPNIAGAEKFSFTLPVWVSKIKAVDNVIPQFYLMRNGTWCIGNMDADRTQIAAAFNLEYFRELAGEDVDMYVSLEENMPTPKPVMIFPAGADHKKPVVEQEWAYILMPMKI